jgi:hypothetical protein
VVYVVPIEMASNRRVLEVCDDVEATTRYTQRERESELDAFLTTVAIDTTPCGQCHYHYLPTDV